MSNTVRFVVLLAIVVIALTAITQSVELSIVGHVLGHGIQSLNYSGDMLNVTIYQNGTFFINGSA